MDRPRALKSRPRLRRAEPTAVSRVGEVYELGPHRLVCGDATKPGVLESLLGSDSVGCLWTDPPYGIDYEGGGRVEKYGPRRKLENDDSVDILPALFDACLRVVPPGACWYVAGPTGKGMLSFVSELLERGVFRQTLAWVKNAAPLSRSRYHGQFEAIFFGWTPGAPGRWYGGRKRTTVLYADKPPKNLEHPTMKPVGLIVQCIEAVTLPGDVVLDPCGGSGSTLIAAAKLGRRARLAEIDPLYADVIRRRWTRYAIETGTDPGPGRLD